MIIHIIRHGESMGNLDKEFYSYPDSCVCLTTDGVKQAIDCASKIKKDEYIVYSSEFTRAKQTAQIVKDILRIKSETIIDGRLNERRYHRKHGKIQFEDYHFKNEDIDSQEETTARLRPFVDEIINNRSIKDKNILIFCHAGISFSFVEIFEELSPEDTMKIRTKNCEIKSYEYNFDTKKFNKYE